MGEDGVHKRAELNKIPLIAKDSSGRIVNRKMHEIIDELRNRKVISDLTAGIWRRLQGIRNDVFHAKVTAPTERDIRDLVQEVIEIDVSNRDIERTRQSKVKKT